MILYENGLLLLDYNPTTDILTAELPNAVEYGVPELARSMEIVADHVRNYAIKGLLLDSSSVLVDQIEHAAYSELVRGFFEKLIGSRLVKVARVSHSGHGAAERTVAVTGEALRQLEPSFQFKLFAGRAQALDWLLDVQESASTP